MTRKIWFQLVDAETRGAYEDAQKASVSSDVVNDIGDLRQEIWDKFCDDILEDVVADQLCIYSNRAVYDDEDGQPLEDDSPIGSFGTANDALIVVVKPPVVKPPTPLILTVHATYPAFLKKAVKIANIMLMHSKKIELELDADKTTTENLRGVKVEFRRPKNGFLCSWTERSKTAKVIFVNEVLRDRMAMIDQAESPHEYQCIVFIMAARIFHECAHLTLRWKNILDSPSKFGFDVGEYMEVALFQGICGVDIQRNTQAILKQPKGNKWTKEMPVLDVVIKLRGLSVVRADHLNKFFTEEELCDKGLFPIDRKAYQRTEGATVFLGADCDRKRRREDPNIMIPPLCGISKRGSSST